MFMKLMAKTIVLVMFSLFFDVELHAVTLHCKPLDTARIEGIYGVRLMVL